MGASLSSIFFLQVATAKESTLNGKSAVIDQSIEAMVDVKPIVKVVEQTPKKKAGPIVKAFMQNIYTEQYFKDSVLASYFPIALLSDRSPVQPRPLLFDSLTF